MTAFAINSGGTEYFDQKTGGSTNATFDTYTISAGSTFVVRTDTYACPNHTTAFGSLDHIATSGTGGTVKFDPTYTREIDFTGGSGTVPAYGTTISQGGVSGVFLGVWANWQSQTVTPSSAMPASGYIKLGGITGGSFAAGALTGITATCSGADRQSWIEVLSPENADWTASRLLTIKTDTSVWYEIGTTNGTAGQVIPCPTTGSFAGIFPAIWVETSAGSGVYEHYFGMGTLPASASVRTDSTCKFFWQTTSGILIGSDGTNNVGYLPPTGCKVRIPAVIWSSCTRTVSGSGNRTLPNNNPATRSETNFSSGGSLDLKGVVIFTYLNVNGAFSVNLENCAINRYFTIRSVKTPLTINEVVCSPNQNSSPTNAFELVGCFYGGTISNSTGIRYDAGGGVTGMLLQACQGFTLSNIKAGAAVLRASSSLYSLSVYTCQNITATNCIGYGATVNFESSSGITANSCGVINSINTGNTSSGTAQISGVRFLQCSGNNILNGVSLPVPNQGPYLGLFAIANSDGVKARNIGSYASPLALNNAVTGYIFSSGGSNTNVRIDRCYATGLRVGIQNATSGESGITFTHVSGDDATATVNSANNAVIRGCRYAGAATASTGVFGSHWETRYTGNTTGVVQLRFNEPTSNTASQYSTTSGTVLFDALGKALLLTNGDQGVWEMPEFAIGYTAFTNSLPAVAGTNVTSAGSGVWGNHLLEFQINTGSGYNGTWLQLTGANLSGQSITSSTGFKLKIRITCQVSNSSNAISNLNIAMTTTSADQSTNLYPLDTYTLTLSGLVSGSDIVILQAGTSNIIKQIDANSGSTYSYTYETIQNVDIGILKAGYKVLYARNYALTSADATLPIAQEIDRNYA